MRVIDCDFTVTSRYLCWDDINFRLLIGEMEIGDYDINYRLFGLAIIWGVGVLCYGLFCSLWFFRKCGGCRLHGPE